VTQHIFPRVDEQANALRNAAGLPYHDLLDGEIVRLGPIVETAAEVEGVSRRPAATCG
jgi:hypothetical protein